MWREPLALRLVYIQNVGTYPEMGASLMTKYDNEWTQLYPIRHSYPLRLIPDQIGFARLLITTLLDRILQQRAVCCFFTRACLCRLIMPSVTSCSGVQNQDDEWFYTTISGSPFRLYFSTFIFSFLFCGDFGTFKKLLSAM